MPYNPQYARVGSLPIQRDEHPTASVSIPENTLTGFSSASYSADEPIYTLSNDTENQYVAQRGGIYLQNTGTSYPRATQVGIDRVGQINLENEVKNFCDDKGNPTCQTPGSVPPINQLIGGKDQLTCMLNTLLSMIAAQTGGLDISAIIQCGSNPNPNPGTWSPGLFDLFSNSMITYIRHHFAGTPVMDYLINHQIPPSNIYNRYKDKIDKFFEFRDLYAKTIETLDKLLKLDGQQIMLPINCKSDDCVEQSNPNDPNACPPECAIPVIIRFIRGKPTPTVTPMLDALCNGVPFPIGVNLPKLDLLWDKWKDNPGTQSYPVFPSDPNKDWYGPKMHQVTVVDFACKDGKLWLKVQDSFLDEDTGKPRVFVIEIDPKDFSKFDKIVKPGIPIEGNTNGMNILGVVVSPKYTPEQIAAWCENECGKIILQCTPTITVTAPPPSTPAAPSATPTSTSTSTPAAPSATPTSSTPAPTATPSSSSASPVPTPSSSSGGSMPTPSISA